MSFEITDSSLSFVDPEIVINEQRTKNLRESYQEEYSEQVNILKRLIEDNNE